MTIYSTQIMRVVFFIMVICASAVLEATELSVNKTLLVSHPLATRTDINETENDAYTATAVLKNGITLGYSRYLNTYWMPSQGYLLGYTHDISPNLSALVGVMATTGYTPVTGLRLTPIPLAQLSVQIPLTDSLSVGPTAGILGKAIISGVSLTFTVE